MHKRCCFCLEELNLNDPDSFYEEAISWVTGPKLQSPKLRNRTGRKACVRCIHNMEDGQAPDQPTLFEEEE